MNCVNKNSQEFKHLVLQSKLPELVVEAKISIWQEQHGLDSYPTLEDLSGIKESIKEESKVEKTQLEDKFKNQVVNLKFSINNITNLLAKTPKDSPRYEKLKLMQANMKDLLAKYEISKNKSYLYELAEIELDNIEKLITQYELGNREIKIKDVTEVWDRLDSLYFLPEVALKVDELRNRYHNIAVYITENLVEKQANIKKGLSYNELLSNKKDIGGFEKYTGALTNVENPIARTIGSLIKSTQLEISSKQSAVYEDIKSKVEELKEYAKSNGQSLKDVYSLFIQDTGKTTVLTRPYTSEFYNKLSEARKNKDKSIYKIATYDESIGQFVPIDKIKYTNPNYTKIQKTKELKSFYEFYQKTIKESFDRLPINRQTQYLKDHPQDFIPNMFTESLTDVLKIPGIKGKSKGLVKYITGMKRYEISKDDFIKDADLERDVIPVQYLTKLTGDKKSKDLGESLFKFAAMTIEHEELSDILPQTRLLQRSLADNKFINPHKSKEAIPGLESNIYKMVDAVIDMQILGKKTKGFDEITVETLHDDEGNVTGKKVIKAGELADFALNWNSLLRIGLNPFTAFTNVVVGEIGNIIEATGGRFFNVSDLKKASGMFFGQIFSKNSKMNALVERYPILQELTDYEYAANISIRKGLTGEKLKNYMYSAQKAGEVFLQTRAMVAMMLHTKPDGKTSLWDMLDDKGDVKSEYLKHFGTKGDFKEYMLRTSTRIMGVNEQIHGRYSTRDAAILNQNVWAKLAFQFKKWIPAAIEARVGEKKFSDRLMDYTEGRWITVFNLAKKAKDTLDRMQKGELTELEVYNAKKTLTEAVILLGTIVGAMWLGWDDDEKRKRSAWYKETMNQLDKVSGDILFFANPKNVTAMSKSPFAITKLATSVINTATYLPYGAYIGDYKVKAGPHKGENKFYRSLGTIIPGYNQLGQNIPDLFNDEKYRDYTP